jgi:lipoprotein-anchoring transpeptidase ErfK/SrfK
MTRSTLLVTTFAATLTACTAANPPAPVTPAPSVAAAAAAPAATAPTPPAAEHVVSAADLSDHLGDSPETAVAVPKDAPNEGIDFENRWIYNRYGRFRRTSGGIASAPPNRHFEEVKVELADHSTRTIYFDITDNWNAWRPAPR